MHKSQQHINICCEWAHTALKSISIFSFFYFSPSLSNRFLMYVYVIVSPYLCSHFSELIVCQWFDFVKPSVRLCICVPLSLSPVQLDSRDILDRFYCLKKEKKIIEELKSTDYYNVYTIQFSWGELKTKDDFTSPANHYRIERMSQRTSEPATEWTNEWTNERASDRTQTVSSTMRTFTALLLLVLLLLLLLSTPMRSFQMNAVHLRTVAAL